jgi:D-serine deaminase-like pyridoxal phosphate-dependent protein
VTGQGLQHLSTPVLLLDRDALEANIEAMAKSLEGTGVALRPHFKTHRCPAIARLQIARGAVGVCCQTVGEAEVAVREGITSVTLTNQIVDSGKLGRLARLAKEADVRLCVDHMLQIERASREATREGVEIGILVEVDVGGRRCGVPLGRDVPRLAGLAVGSEGLRFLGIQAYNGKAQGIIGTRGRTSAAAATAVRAAVARGLLQRAGIPCSMVTGGGTGTVHADTDSGVFTEVQPGSYAVMDATYAAQESETGYLGDQYHQAIFVLATVISTPMKDRIVVDVGLKSVAVDQGLPTVAHRPDWRFVSMSDEHGVIELPPGKTSSLGERLLVIPGHCDPTANLHDEFALVRHGRAEGMWPIAARGKSA